MLLFVVFPSYELMHFPSVSQFNGNIFLVLYGLTITTKVEMMQQNYDVITGANYRADTEDFTQRRCKKLTSCQFLENTKT